MFQENATQTGRALLKAANMASKNESDVYAYIDGLGRLDIREIETMEEDETFATVRGFLDSEDKLTWLVPLAAVRAVEIRDQWAS